MLPNKMKISERATSTLKRFETKTGLTVNYAARLAFFDSLERGFVYDPKTHVIEHSGRELDKHSWLGEHYLVTEYLLKENYPDFTKSQLHDAWAAHVDNGVDRFDGNKPLAAIALEIVG